MIRKLKICFIIFVAATCVQIAKAEIGLLALSNGSSVGASFPCTPEQRQAGAVKALNCNVSDGYNFCDFLLTIQENDQSEYARHGMKWVEAVHSSYVEQLGGYKKGRTIVSTYPYIGSSLTYEFLRQQSGVVVQVNGVWIVFGKKLIRATTSCGRDNPSYLKAKRDLFLNAITVVK